MTAPLACFPPQGLMTPILEQAEIVAIQPAQLDARLAEGWRHFGEKFFRYNFAFHEGVLCGVVPLRLRLAGFSPSKSHRRVLRRNADLETRLVPARHCAEYDGIFARHKARFEENVPDSLRDFLSADPAEVPCTNVALEARLGDALVAVSFLDLGTGAASSVYAMFDPAHASRSLGIFTLLLEIEHARRLGKRFHYLGYAYTVHSPYDYKKRFRGVEGCDWGRGWTELPGGFTWSRRVEGLGG
ncbi:MAG: hypothetical protein PHC88_00600 [Terrimicrobiaceae bacterium]|nr:hypothetical protein [Terrimicrobiaceae bacterium]